VKLAPKILLAFAVPTAVTLIVSIIVFRALTQGLDTTERVRHTEEGIATANEVLGAAVNAQAAVFAFIITRDEQRLSPRFANANATFDKLAPQLGALVASEPLQVARVDRLIRLHRQWLATAAYRIAAVRAADIDRAIENVRRGTGPGLVDRMRVLVREFVLAEQGILRVRRASSDAASRAARMLLFVGFGLVLLTEVAVGLGLSRRLSGNAREVTTAAQRLADGDMTVRAEVRSADELGELAGAFNRMAQRIGDLHRAERRRALDLEVANAELTAFTYSVSHDLRAPLRAVDGFTSIVLSELAPDLTPKAHRYLSMVSANAQHMGKLIDGLLMLSRLGQAPLVKKPVDVYAIANEVLIELQAAEDGDRPVEAMVHPLPAVDADATLVRQVLVNLLSNALKYTRGRDPARIEVGADLGHGPAFFVRDNGVGFDMRYASKLFGAFQRLHRAEDFEGTGIGLAIVSRIVRRHGGRVWAQSEPDRGATFYFTLGGDAGR
jgi:signal transduction histidine kinase